MDLLIDGNIILDVLQRREPFYEDSALIWKMCETDMVRGHVSALTFANLVYIMRKELDSDGIVEVLKKLSLIFRFEDLCAGDLNVAARMKWGDFEDALQVATAERIKADLIITRNVNDFEGSVIKACLPVDFLMHDSYN